MERKEVIDVLTRGGHTVSKAIEIALDYERGDDWARKWVSTLQSEKWPLRRRKIEDAWEEVEEIKRDG